MAKRRRRRPGAGPPPVRNPRRDAGTARSQATPEDAAKPRGHGAPQPISFRRVVIQAAVAAVIYWAVLAFSGVSGAAGLLFAVIAFLIMIPLGLVISRALYRYQLRRWQRRQAGG
jgi:hypothetical protein